MCKKKLTSSICHLKNLPRLNLWKGKREGREGKRNETGDEEGMGGNRAQPMLKTH